jgi:S1-C subfamily serine protease
MSEQTANNLLISLSNAMAEAVARAGEFTLLVNGRQRMPASGIAYAPDLVLTADHAVERDDGVTVLLPDGSEQSVTLAGRDPGSDLALLRLERQVLMPARPVAEPAMVGQIVLAVGRPDTAGMQASLGVISAIGGPVRTGHGGVLERYIRTDAIPYPGFSGGPLIDPTGAVVGINTSGLARGASLAIPAGYAWQIAAALAEHGGVRRGYLGIRSQQVELSSALQGALGREQATGLLVVGVEPGSPAESGGLLLGDLLVGINGEPVIDHDELLSKLVGSLVGQATPLEILRGGQPVTLPVTIDEFVSERREGRHRHWRRRR